MAGTPESTGGPVRPAVALGLATVTFVALLIFGLGMVSLALSADIIEAPGLGQVPGIVATALTTGAFALVLWLSLRRRRPSYWPAVWTALACYAVYNATMWLAVATAADLATATAVAGRIATTGFGVAIAAAAALAAAGGISLVRTRSQRPRWPWEDEFDE
ncbi:MULTISPECIES: hypothetical protein [unclassified Microbacterium]|uniref:hypothetical protein n=1 Tax=unclassified Microbacterium TaxID=2609290 RepID=UPI00214ABEAF|nr:MULTISPECIES: hypothetical protein [unclassified Microbacterium]MCR2808809.1 hypothetical protein [Microbacterium sp. zg.B185]WIM18769.1 hypothetical protein QNO12_14430 [Microbacterium sp. zg-B185]